MLRRIYQWNPETVRVLLVTTLEPTKGQQALPDMASLLRERLTTKAVDISVEVLKAGTAQVVARMLPILDDLPESNTYEVASVDLALAIDTQGQIAIIATASAGVQVSSGITVTITTKQKTFKESEAPHGAS